jgi:hypothetical protein
MAFSFGLRAVQWYENKKRTHGFGRVQPEHG